MHRSCRSSILRLLWFRHRLDALFNNDTWSCFLYLPWMWSSSRSFRDCICFFQLLYWVVGQIIKKSHRIISHWRPPGRGLCLLSLVATSSSWICALSKRTHTTLPHTTEEKNKNTTWFNKKKSRIIFNQRKTNREKENIIEDTKMMTFKTVLLLAGELIYFQWDLNVTVH